MGSFASGKNAFAISDRSGFRYRYKDMRKEWNGSLVGKDEFEPKQPQLGPFRTVSDPQALKDARPQQPDTNTPFMVKTTNGIIYLGKVKKFFSYINHLNGRIMLKLMQE